MAFKKYIKELKRRKVFSASVTYLVLAWIVVQVCSIVLPALDAPEYAMKSIVLISGIGFLLCVILSWIYDITSKGIKKTKRIHSKSSVEAKISQIINAAVVVILLIGIAILYSSLFGSAKTLLSNSGKKSIAVLAFADMSPKKDQEYFSDGISEELLNLLAKVPELRVISRTSSFSYKNKNILAEDIGKQLNISHILEGSVRKSGEVLRITAQLIETQTGAHLWSETYDRGMHDIFNVQDEIAKVVTQKLKVTLLGNKYASKNVDPEAYNLYLQAKHLVHQNTKDAYLHAEELIMQSIQIDSEFAPAWSLLSSINYTGAYNFLTKPLAEGVKAGIEAANKALELDPVNAFAYTNLASLQMLSWNFSGADSNIRKALQLDPGNSQIVGTAALMKLGNLEEAIKLIELAISLDPLSHANYYNLGYYNYLAGNYSEAHKALDKFALHYPNAGIYHYTRSQIFIAEGKNVEALQEAEKETHEFFKPYAKFFALTALQRVNDADQFLNEIETKYGETEAANIADMYAFKGDKKKAFSWLNKAVGINDPVLQDILNFHSFKTMHSDPRWSELIGKMGLPKNHGYPMK